MGIVKISDRLHEDLRVAGNALCRSINAQAEHWMRVGMLAELHPGLNHQDICQLLVRAELAGGLDITVATSAALHTPAAAASTPKPKPAAAASGKPRATPAGRH